MRDFRFSCNVFGVETHEAFIDRCRLVERLGYDTLFAPDHVGAPAPFPVLVAAANATERLRVGTLVLNAAFWNPALLARDIATTDILTGGRLEVGLGAGYMKSEFDAAGVAWEPFGTRVDRMAETIQVLEHWFRTGDHAGLPGGRAPQPVQRHGFHHSGPPLIVGGNGDRVLTLAAEQADIVAVTGIYQVKGEKPGTSRLGTAAEAEERVRFVQKQAGARADEIEWNILVQRVVQTTDRRAAAESLAAQFTFDMAVDEVLETPFLLIGTVDEMAEQVLRNRERFGFSYYTVHDPHLEAFAPVIEALRP
ncbi:LLM class F420-dependent oxidoreductase [Actinoplanes regularis]|uniref:LLM class F420-dependent oxidoreductase n=1 Tax=Actinoplanes regularis TaxID=52697 RepID=UPI0024A3023C|nr:LLM class F420-dependent oxidoreductase [Actinoplanes regularis]GLW35980.1 LLM class F420-dependent oxidoreductase [Actinoplanes regularis]